MIGPKNETHFGHFNRNEILFWVIKFHVDTIRNEIIQKSKHLHMYSGPFVMGRFLGPPPKHNFIPFHPQ